MINDEIFMKKALDEAKLALEKGEVPIGAVIVKDGQIVATAHNLRETDRSATAHAELLAIEKACKALGGWRLTGCELYVTLEPCPMCAGAIINSRIDRVIFGSKDEKAGACGSVMNLFAADFNHRPKLTVGVLEEECSAILKSFFASLREKRKKSI